MISQLSGIEVNQNQAATGSIVPSPLYQTFLLPDGYERDGVVPDLTGVQVCLQIDDEDTQINWTFEELDGDWITRAQGTLTESPAAGPKVWVDIYFDEAFPVEDVSNQFRIGLTTTAPWWYAAPNPLPDGALENGDGDPAIVDGASALFRVLAASADNGIDFLNNRYRSSIIVSKAGNVGEDSDPNNFWLSKPNPSKFAIESLYFDVHNNDSATVIDRFLVDPITPGLVFHIYHSIEGNPGDWDNKLWTPIAETYRADRRQEYALPAPVTAKYLKLEFSHLQAKSYAPGVFHQPIVYKKHPKWVLDYFLAQQMAVTDDPFIAKTVNINYNALRLAYDYYLDDLRQFPDNPPELNTTNLQKFLTERTDLSDKVNYDTLSRISSIFDRFTLHPTASVSTVSLIGEFAASRAGTTNYPIENLTVDTTADTSQVSTLNRTALLQEQSFPAMFFYVTARHIYREVEAPFEFDRAYFAGIREVAFYRDNYSVPSDNELYVEATGDTQNVWRSDFSNQDGIWRI